MNKEFGSTNVKGHLKKNKTKQNKKTKTPSEKKTQSKYFACSCKHAKGSIIFPVVANRLQVSHDIHDAKAKPLSCCYYANTLGFFVRQRRYGVSVKARKHVLFINSLYIPYS